MARPLLLDLALTHILGRKRQTIVSVMGVALGVGFFIAMAALMQGFQGYFVDTVINASPHITVRDQFREPAVQPVAAAFRGGAVVLHGLKPRDEIRGIRKAGTMVSALSEWPGLSVAPSLDGPVILRYGSADKSAVLIGIVPEREVHVTQLEDDMVQGHLADLASAANGIVIGLGLANKLGAKMGDSLNAISPAGVILRVKVVGLFRTGIVSLDEGQAYILLKKAQILQSRANVINQIRIRLNRVDEAREVAARIEALYGYKSESWQEANEGVFGVFRIQNADHVFDRRRHHGGGGVRHLQHHLDRGVREVAGYRDPQEHRPDRGRYPPHLPDAGADDRDDRRCARLADRLRPDLAARQHPVRCRRDGAERPLLPGVVGDALLDRRDVLAGRVRRGGLDTGAAGGGGQPGRYHPGCGLTAAVVEARGVGRVLPGPVPVTLVEDIDLSIGEGEFVAITGPSGSGKSSLLYLLGLLDRPTSGTIILEGRDTAEAGAAELAALRLSKLGFVFQFHFLLPEFTVLGNVMIPMRKLGGCSGAGVAEARRKRCWTTWAWAIRRRSCRRSFPAASASGSPSPARSPTARASFWPTSRRGTWTRRARRRSSTSSRGWRGRRGRR